MHIIYSDRHYKLKTDRYDLKDLQRHTSNLKLSKNRWSLCPAYIIIFSGEVWDEEQEIDYNFLKEITILCDAKGGK